MNAPIHKLYSACRHTRDRRAATTLWWHTIGCLITLIFGILVTPLAPAAQPPGHIPVVAVLSPGTFEALSDPKSSLNTFRQGLRDLGYVEGQTIRLEQRYAAWQWDRLPSLAAELVQLQPDVIVTWTTPGALAAKQSTTTIPIMVAVSEDLVAEGIVASLAQPGGNITGQNLRDPELAGKRLELLKEAVPTLTQVAVLVHAGDHAHDRVPGHIAAEAQALIAPGPLPPNAVVDALHIAIAAVNGSHYLLTWNCTHIANAAIRSDIEDVCRAHGYEPPVLCTPEELLET